MHRTLAILANSHLAIGRETMTEAILRSVPPAHGPMFLREEEPVKTLSLDDYDWPAGITVTLNTDIWYDQDSLDPKVIRRRFQAYVQSLRGREGWQHVPKIRQTGKRPAARWGTRSREQRTRRP